MRIYPAPSGEPLSTNFTVAVGGSNVPVYTAAVATADPARRMRIFTRNDNSYVDHTSVGSLDVRGTVEVTVTCPKPVRGAKILPAPSGIIPVVSGNRITFVIPKPQQLVLEVGNDWVHSLQLFADPMEEEAPDPKDTNVIYFGPGVHQIQDLKVTSGKTVYIAGGAVVYGQINPAVHGGAVISLIGTNIALRGKGIIDGSLCPGHTRNLVKVKGANISLEGVIMRDSSTWTLPIRNSEQVTVKNIKIFGYRGNSDGIDICNSRPRHADINARLLRIAHRIFCAHSSEFSSAGVEQHDINIVVLFRLRFGAKLSECAVFHQQRFVAGGFASKGSP